MEIYPRAQGLHSKPTRVQGLGLGLIGFRVYGPGVRLGLGFLSILLGFRVSGFRV